jgi:hypothetical protein
MIYTLEQLSTKIDNLESKLSCLCDTNDGPCEYDSGISWVEQTGGIQYTLVLSYVEPSANMYTQILNIQSTTTQTPQEFLDILNATYGPNLTFSLNPDGTVHLVAKDFAIACFLQLINNQQMPNTTTSWESSNSVRFTVMQVLTSDGTSQGYFNGDSWGVSPSPTSAQGYLDFDGDTDKLLISYDAAIPSALSVCLHLIQNGNEIWSSPFNLNIPTSGTGFAEISGLTGLLDPAYDLTILVNDAC